MTTRTDRFYRAQQLIVEHPEWGRRRINTKLRTEFGRGLRDKDVDALTKPHREARKAGIPPELTGVHPRKSNLQRIMRDAGFLRFEIFGTYTEKWGKRLGLGQIKPDKEHPFFLQVMDKMIRSRRREHQSFVKQGENRGWSRAKINARWGKRVRSHYKHGNFPAVGKGNYLTKDKTPSPWLLYRAWEQKLIREAPFGGDAWGTPRPEKRRKVDFVARPVSRSATQREIRRHEQNIRELEQSISRANAEGNTVRARQFVNQRQNLLDTIEKLRG